MPSENLLFAHIERQRGWRWTTSLLRLASHLYGTALKARHFAYDVGLCTEKTVGGYVVSVGNIACGGTGKTPFLRMLVEHLAHPRRIAILTRGYRGRCERGPQPFLVSAGNGPLASAAKCGDEAYWLAQTLPEVSIWAGKKRCVSARAAVAGGKTLLLLDDGLQHRALSRDIEIVMCDTQDLASTQYLLPTGRLRDLPSRLQVADLFVLNHSRTEEEYQGAVAHLRNFSDAPAIWVRMQLDDTFVARIAKKNVAVFCAIGRPERFLSTLSQAGAHVIATLFRRDHLPFSERILHRFASEAQNRGAETLVCTEKDAVKLQPHSLQHLPLPLLVAPARLIIVQGHEAWGVLLDRIQKNSFAEVMA